MRPRIGISGRLLGEENRFNGGRARHRFLAEELGAHVDWVPYTAETETALGVLWETWRLTGQSRLLLAGRTNDALSGLPTPAYLDGYVAQSDPRGVGRLPGHRGAGRGVFARRLAAAFPLLPVTEDALLDTPAERALFAERVFAAARLRALFAQPWRPRDLVGFHTRHKLQILAHDPARYQQAGRLVARAGSRPHEETEAAYRRLFAEALAGDVTTGRHVNAMRRAFRQIGERVDDARRHTLLERIEAYRRGELSFDVPLALLARHAADERLRWTAQQTYLHPFPGDLRRHLWAPDAESVI
jgi:uncharacterized protein YbgA (DUF1722 family)/uncharacterized protein YbbK (DUF523 family)